MFAASVDLVQGVEILKYEWVIMAARIRNQYSLRVVDIYHVFPAVALQSKMIYSWFQLELK